MLRWSTSFAILLLVFGCSDGAVLIIDGRKVRVTKDSSVELQFAVMDNGKGSKLRQTRIDRYTQALDRLGRDCPESRKKVADMVVITRKSIEEDTGRRESLLQVLESLNRGYSSDAQELGITCAEILAAFVALA